MMYGFCTEFQFAGIYTGLFTVNISTIIFAVVLCLPMAVAQWLYVMAWAHRERRA
jgi:hypothetical protein